MNELASRIKHLSPEKLELLRRKLDAKGEKPITSIQKRQDTTFFPITEEQKRIWFLQQLDPDSIFYNIPAIIRFDGDLYISSLEDALNRIIERHQVLSSFYSVNNAGEPVQGVLPDLHLTLNVFHINYEKQNGHPSDLDIKIKEFIKTPFNLETGPLIDACLFKVNEKRHYFVLKIHHIIFDGWSVGIFQQELFKLYSAISQNLPASLEDNEISFFDYAAWLEERATDALLGKQLTFWKNYLDGMPPALNLPIDFARPSIQSHKGKQIKFALDTEITKKLGAWSKANNTSLFSLHCSVVQLFLHKITLQSDFGLGVPMANRKWNELSKVLGFFVNSLVLRSQFSTGLKFSELVKKTRDDLLEADQNIEISFNRIVEACQPTRELSHSPLFQVMFDLQKAPYQKINIQDCQVETVEFDPEISKFDLLFFIYDYEDSFQGAIEYNTDLFSQDTIERFAGYFQELVRRLSEDPDQSIEELSVIPQAEMKKLEDWNDTTIQLPESFKFPINTLIHEMFEERVQETPDEVALVYGHEQITFEQLNRRANYVASFLRKNGIGAENFVAICVDRSFDMLVGILGILKSGGVYVPMDPEYPTERLSYILNDSGATVLLTQKHLVDNLPETQAQIVWLDDYWQDMDKASSENYKVSIDLENLAYVIYTSGSTGKPKGVTISHKSAVALISWGIKNYTKEQVKGFFFSTSMCFDVSVFEMFVPLCGHGSLIIGKNALELPNIPAKDNVTLVSTVPSAISQLIKMDAIPSSVNTIHLAGEFLSPAIVDQLYKRETIKYVCDLYGPTEDTVYSTHAVRYKNTPATIGRPLGGKQIYVLDFNMNPVPVGVAGQMFIGGIGQARGYYNRPDLTAEKFVPHPFSKNGGERLYQTGDLVRYFNDGSIEYIGRIDHQVKIRGYRIELGEIETALLRHVGIRDAVVVVREDEPGDKRLVAYFAGTDKALDIESLRGYLSEKLPVYMIPSVFVRMDELPLTNNGKVNRKALPKPEYSDIQKKNKYVAADSDEEKWMAGIWKEVIQIDKVGVNDNFFELGGDSLKAAILVNRIQKETGESIQVANVFKYPTITDFSYFIKQTHPQTFGNKTAFNKKYKKNHLTFDRIKKVPRRESFPLSFDQQRLWFIDQFEAGSIEYNIPVAIRLEGTLNIDLLEKSLNKLVQRHESLRTIFYTDEEGRARQKINPFEPIEIVKYSCEELPESEREHFAGEIASREARYQFNLIEGPLLRATLITVDPQSFILQIVAHHIISDGWSTNILIKEISELYNSFVEYSTPSLPDLEIQFADFVMWQLESISENKMQEHVDYWKQKLAGAPSLVSLPLDFVRRSDVNNEGKHIAFSLHSDLSSKIKLFCEKYGVTPYAYFMTVFHILLAKLSGQDDILVGTPSANRNRHEVEPLIGFFANTLVIRSRLDKATQFNDLLKQVSENIVEALEHQELPFQKLVDEIQPDRTATHSPIFQVMFSFMETSIDMINFPGLEVAVYPVSSGTTKFDLTVSMIEQEDQFWGVFEYDAHLFRQETVERFVGYFENLLKDALDEPLENIYQLDMLPAEEKEQIFQRFNSTSEMMLEDHCLNTLFEKQVEATPDEIAVIYKDHELSFRELNNWANQLAGLLKQKGIGPEKMVGIMLNRSVEYIASIIAILKVGAAYVPIDPTHPAERVSYIISDACLDFLISESEMLAKLPQVNIPIFQFDRELTQLEEMDIINPENVTEPGNTAYVIYTSGSTGKPKGVMITHFSACNLMTGLYEKIYSQLEEKHLTISLNASLLFDASVQQLVMMMRGHTLCIIPDEIRMDGATLLNYAEQKKIELLDCVPSQVQLLIESGLFGESNYAPLAMLPGGEAIDAKTWSVLKQSKSKVFNMYGPTECTVDSTTCWINNEKDGPNIGRPLSNVNIYIVDRNILPVPVGVAGELCVSGNGLARGYLNKPVLTAEKFIPNPFNGKTGERLYRTGDLCRFLPDGRIEFIARIDNQVKIRGYRMELGEIEAALEEYKGINSTVVIVREDVPGDKRLVAYYTALNKKLDVESLRSHVRERLPLYMIPSAFMQLAEFPLTPNGKVNRNALPKPEYSDIQIKTEFIAPKTDREKQLNAIWRAVLNIEKVGLDDNFFELGGDSILSIQIIARARQIGLEFTPKELFENPTIKGIASVLRETNGKNGKNGKHHLASGDVMLTPIQRHFFAKNYQDQNHWNQSVILESKKPLNIGILEQVVSHLQRHHDALRMRFVQQDDQWNQYYAKSVEKIPLSVIDLTDAEMLKVERQFVVEANKLQASLNIQQGPIFRVGYFKLGPKLVDRLVFAIHHLVIDGISWRALLVDFQTIYNQLEIGEKVQLPPKTASFKEWAEKLAEYADSSKVLDEYSRWSKMLNQSVPKLLPEDCKIYNTEACAKIVQKSLSVEKTSQLFQVLPRSLNVPVKTVFLTILAKSMRILDNDSIYVELEGHGREELHVDLDVSRTVGWFTNPYPVYLHVPSNENIKDSIARIDSELAEIPQNGFSFGLLKHFTKDENIRQVMVKIPKPEISFNYLGQFDNLHQENGRFNVLTDIMIDERSPNAKRDYLIDISMSVMNGELLFRCLYCDGLQPESTMEAFANEFMNQIESLLLLFDELPENNNNGYNGTPELNVSQDDLESILSEMEDDWGE